MGRIIRTPKIRYGFFTIRTICAFLLIAKPKYCTPFINILPHPPHCSGSFIELTSAFKVSGRQRQREHTINMMTKKKDGESNDDTNAGRVSEKFYERSERIRYRGRVAYDGTTYSGWQVQSKGKTVQVCFASISANFVLLTHHFIFNT